MWEWIVYTALNENGIHENWFYSAHISKLAADKMADEFNKKYTNPDAWKCVCHINAVEALEIQNMPQWYYEGN